MGSRCRRKILIGLIVWAFVHIAVGVWAETTDGPSSPSSSQRYIRFIRFKGVHSLSTDVLEKIMETRPRRFRWFGGKPLDQRVLIKDLDRIQKYYKSRGFYEAKVVSHRLIPLLGRDYVLEITVHEGEPIRVKRVDLKIDGKDSGPWHDGVFAVLPLKPGNVFTTPGYEKIDKTVKRYLADWGYARAKVDVGGILNKATHQAELRVDVRLGPPCYFGSITVEGTHWVDPSVVRRELVFREGDRFRASAVAESQKRLMDLRLFSFVDVQVEKDDASGNVLPVRVVVKEAKRQTVRFGAGYGTEDKFRGLLGWEYRNFLGKARNLQVTAKASALDSYVEGRFLQPHFWNTDVVHVGTGGYSRENQESFENEQFYIRNRFNWKRSERFQIYVAQNVESNRLLNVYLEPDETLPADKEGENYFVSSLVLGCSYRRLDDLLEPTRGWQLLQRLEWGGSFIGSDVSFIKFSLEGRSYFPLDSFGVLALRARWGSIKELEDTHHIPIFKRYFCGGSNSVRGYPYQKLGPLDNDGNPLGGLTLLEGNVDWRFPIKGSWEGVLFFDVGNVYESSYELLWDQLRMSAGVGLRYKTPVGPVRVDVGYQLNPPPGAPFNRYQVHFSIGHAF